MLHHERNFASAALKDVEASYISYNQYYCEEVSLRKSMLLTGFNLVFT